MSRVKNFDILKYIYLAILFFSYYEGYASYISGHPEYSAAWAVCCAAGLFCLTRRVCYLRFLHMRIGRVDKLSGKAFEKYLAAQFRHLGYRVKQTEDSHDYGADLLVKKRGEFIVIQAKRYEKNVGIAAVQEAVGAIAYYEADRAMVVTNSHFTKSARNLARLNDVELWGREEIIRNFSIRQS